MSNLKKLVLVVTMILMIVCLASTAFANDFEEIPDDSLGNRVNNVLNNTTNNTANNTTNNTTNNATNNTSNNSAVNNMLSNRNTSSVYNNTNLPKTGSSDGIALFVVIAIFGVSAVYAYKKITDYNIK